MVRTKTPSTVDSNIVNVAYLVSRFPKLSETFVLYEYLALRSASDTAAMCYTPLSLSLYALKEEREVVRHAEAQQLLDSVVFRSPWHIRTWSQAVLTAFGSPSKTLRTLGKLCWFNRTSPRLLATSLIAFPGALALAREMSQNGVEHVHAHFAHVATTTAFVIQQVAGIPFSFTGHGSDLHRDQTMLREKIAAASRAITVSDFNAELMRKHAAPAMRRKIEIIHCGADHDVFRPDAQALHARLEAQTKDVVRVGCVGSLLPVKGQRYLLEALASLKDGPYELHCTLIGDGPNRAALEALASKLELQIEFAGALARSDVAKRLRQFDIVVAPSAPTKDGRKEGIPVALMEAMASGAAVIASDLTGIPELVVNEQTGLLVPAGDAQQLAQAISRLCADAHLRSRLIQSAQEKVAREFNLRRNAQKLLGLLTAPRSGAVQPVVRGAPK